MTLSKRNVEGVKFAYIPRSCDYCKRVFWLEPYTMKRKVNPYVGFVFKYYYCKECIPIDEEVE